MKKENVLDSEATTTSNSFIDSLSVNGTTYKMNDDGNIYVSNGTAGYTVDPTLATTATAVNTITSNPYWNNNYYSYYTEPGYTTYSSDLGNVLQFLTAKEAASFCEKIISRTDNNEIKKTLLKQIVQNIIMPESFLLKYIDLIEKNDLLSTYSKYYQLIKSGQYKSIKLYFEL